MSISARRSCRTPASRSFPPTTSTMRRRRWSLWSGGRRNGPWHPSLSTMRRRRRHAGAMLTRRRNGTSSPAMLAGLSFCTIRPPMSSSRRNSRGRRPLQRSVSAARADRPVITAIDQRTRWRLHMFSRSRHDLYRQIFKPGRVLDVGCAGRRRRAGTLHPLRHRDIEFALPEGRRRSWPRAAVRRSRRPPRRA